MAEFQITLRPEEAPWDAARRNGIDAVYHARDTGGTMHDAGQLAAEAAVEAYLLAQADQPMQAQPEPEQGG